MRPIAAFAGLPVLGLLLSSSAGSAPGSTAEDRFAGGGSRTVVLVAVADSYLRDGAPNQSQGGDTLLRIRSSGKNRALVRFDLDGVEDLVEDLHSATLELYLEENGNNWGTSGRTVGAHALGAGWSEAGATWNCPADANPANSAPDCAVPWNGGTFDASPTDTLLVTNGLTGWVSLDVTADVLATLAGEPHQGWLIKKTNEGQNGLAEFSSREGTPGRVPRLVLVFDGGEAPDTRPPTLAITSPMEGAVLDDPLPETSFAFADDASGVDTATLTVERNGSPLAVSCSFGGSTATCVPTDPLSDGAQTLTATIADRAGNVSAPATVHFTTDAQPHEEPLPPDPATVAPPLDRTVATDLASATAFLYSGDSPIQTGVAPGTIEPRRVAVLRGRVLARGGAALPGVRITVLDHPELGSTLSRADGAFDLAVNGGGVLTVQYEKAGHLTAQRQIAAPWRDYAHLDDVVLLPLDTTVTTVTAGSPVLQVARGSAVDDEDGRRRPTLFFPPGFTAEMVKADGTREPLTALSVRATEYTQGADGPRSMPGPLPPTVAYTWAAELSVDEALAAGAERLHGRIGHRVPEPGPRRESPGDRDSLLARLPQRRSAGPNCVVYGPCQAERLHGPRLSEAHRARGRDRGTPDAPHLPSRTRPAHHLHLGRPRRLWTAGAGTRGAQLDQNLRLRPAISAAGRVCPFLGPVSRCRFAPRWPRRG